MVSALEGFHCIYYCTHHLLIVSVHHAGECVKKHLLYNYRYKITIFVLFYFYLGDVPVMADFSHRDGGNRAPTAEERHVGGLWYTFKELHESIQRCCPITLHAIVNEAASILKQICSFLLYLRVKDDSVAEGVVGEDVSPIVNLLQSQVHHWDASWSHEATCFCGDVGEAKGLLSTSTVTITQQRDNQNEQVLHTVLPINFESVCNYLKQ